MTDGYEVMPTTSPAGASSVSPGTEESRRILNFLAKHEAPQDQGSYGVFLSAADGSDRIELTPQLGQLLRNIVTSLAHGESISILTNDQEISTQQAAEILGLSRPTVVRLIEEGELQAHVPGIVRRRLRLADVLAYREELRERRNTFITESSPVAEDFGQSEINQAVTEARRQA